MSKVYDGGHDHTHCYVNHPRSMGQDDRWMDEGWRSTFTIMLHTGEYVWVAGTYANEGHPRVKRVQLNNLVDKGYDQHGNCILAVPAEWCEYYTEEEANGIEQCFAADDDMLRYARG